MLSDEIVTFCLLFHFISGQQPRIIFEHEQPNVNLIFPQSNSFSAGRLPKCCNTRELLIQTTSPTLKVHSFRCASSTGQNFQGARLVDDLSARIPFARDHQSDFTGNVQGNLLSVMERNCAASLLLTTKFSDHNGTIEAMDMGGATILLHRGSYCVDLVLSSDGSNRAVNVALFCRRLTSSTEAQHTSEWRPEDTLVVCLVVILGIILILLVLLELAVAIVLMVTWQFQKILGKLTFLILVCRLTALFLMLARLGSGAGITCKILGALTRFFLIGAFSLLTAINHNFWSTFKAPLPTNAVGEALRQQVENKKILYYIGAALFIGSTATGISVVLEETLSLTHEYRHFLMPNDTGLSTFRTRLECDDNGALLLYAVPFNCILMLIAFLFGALTFSSIRGHKEHSRLLRKERASDLSTFRLFWKLSTVMGVGWLSEQVTYGVTHVTALYTDHSLIYLRFLPIFLAFLLDIIADVALFSHFVWKEHIPSQLSHACSLLAIILCPHMNKQDKQKYVYKPIK